MGNRTAESVYDAGLWLLLLMLLRRGSRDGPEAGEEYSEERVLRSPAAAPPEYRFFCFSELFLSLFNALLADGGDEGGGAVATHRDLLSICPSMPVLGNRQAKVNLCEPCAEAATRCSEENLSRRAVPSCCRASSAPTDPPGAPSHSLAAAHLAPSWSACGR